MAVLGLLRLRFSSFRLPRSNKAEASPLPTSGVSELIGTIPDIGVLGGVRVFAFDTDEPLGASCSTMEAPAAAARFDQIPARWVSSASIFWLCSPSGGSGANEMRASPKYSAAIDVCFGGWARRTSSP